MSATCFQAGFNASGAVKSAGVDSTVDKPKALTNLPSSSVSIRNETEIMRAQRRKEVTSLTDKHDIAFNPEGSGTELKVDQKEAAIQGQHQQGTFSMTRKGDVSTIIIDNTSFTYNHRLQKLDVKLNTDVTFDYDKSEITPNGRQALDQFADKLKLVTSHLEKAGIKPPAITVDGFTDSRGTESYNQKLSERRAEAVKHYLDSKDFGVEFVAKGHGEKFAKQFAKGQDDPAARAEDRCVRIGIGLTEENFQSLVTYMRSRTEITVGEKKPQAIIPEKKPGPISVIEPEIIPPFPPRANGLYAISNKRPEYSDILQKAEGKFLVDPDTKNIYNVHKVGNDYEVSIYKNTIIGKSALDPQDLLGTVTIDRNGGVTSASGILQKEMEQYRLERSLRHNAGEYTASWYTPEEWEENRQANILKEQEYQKSRVELFGNNVGQLMSSHDDKYYVKIDRAKDGGFNLFVYEKPSSFLQSTNFNDILGSFKYSADGALQASYDGSRKASTLGAWNFDNLK